MQPEEQTIKPIAYIRYMRPERIQELTELYSARLPHIFEHPNLQSLQKDHDYVKILLNKWHNLHSDIGEMPKRNGIYKLGYLPIPGRGITSGILAMEYEEATTFDIHQLSVYLTMNKYDPRNYDIYFLDKKSVAHDSFAEDLANMEIALRARPDRPYQGGSMSGN